MSGRYIVRFLRSDDTETGTLPLQRPNAEQILRSLAVMMRQTDRPHVAYREDTNVIVDRDRHTTVAWLVPFTEVPE